MRYIFLVMILFATMKARADGFPYGVVPLWKIDAARAQIYRNGCYNMETGSKERTCCIGFDAECDNTREMWIHFPQGINFCENMYAYENKKRVYYKAYCSGRPDSITKEVQTDECPLHWPDNPDVKLYYAFPLNPVSDMYDIPYRNFAFGDQAVISDYYQLGKYIVDSYAPPIVNSPRDQNLFVSHAFSAKDVKDMVCMYGPFNQSK